MPPCHQPNSASLSYILTRRQAVLIPELTYILKGIKAGIHAVISYGGNVQHSLTDAGYTAALELESKLPEDAVSDLADESAGDYTGILACTGTTRPTPSGPSPTATRPAHAACSYSTPAKLPPSAQSTANGVDSNIRCNKECTGRLNGND